MFYAFPIVGFSQDELSTPHAAWFVEKEVCISFMIVYN
jgi:hypothetical protein